MQAGNATVYAGSWRHPATEHGFLTAALLQEAGPHARRGLLRPHVLRRPPRHARDLRRLGRRGRADRRPPGEARPEHRARDLRRRHQPDRARRDLLDDVLHAVPRGPDVRHPRPHVGRARRLERRHVGERQRGAELRPEGGNPPRRPLRPGRRVPRGDDRIVGHAGRTTRSCSTARRRCSPTPTRCTSSTTKASGSTCGGRSRCRVARRGGRCCSRPGRRGGAGSLRPAGRS